jgi:hypothetical protein
MELDSLTLIIWDTTLSPSETLLSLLETLKDELLVLENSLPMEVIPSEMLLSPLELTRFSTPPLLPLSAEVIWTGRVMDPLNP